MQKGKVDDAASILRLIRNMKGLAREDLRTRLDFPVELINYHLNTLVSKKLAEFVDSKNGRRDQTIRITDRGVKFLELYEAVRVKYLTNAPSDK